MSLRPRTSAHLNRIVDRSSNLRRHIARRTTGDGQLLEAPQRPLQRVGVQGAHRTPVAGTEGMEQTSSFGTADLPDHNSIGPHPKRRGHQVGQRHTTDTVEVGRLRFEPGHMRSARWKFGGLLDDDDPLGVAEHRQSAGNERGFAGPSGAEYEEVRPLMDQASDPVSVIGSPEPIEWVSKLREPPQRDTRSVHRDGWHGDVASGAVVEADIDHRATSIHTAAGRREQVLDQTVELGSTDAANYFETTTALDGDRTRAVDHHVVDRVVIEELCQLAQPAKPRQNLIRHRCLCAASQVWGPQRYRGRNVLTPMSRPREKALMHFVNDVSNLGSSPMKRPTNVQLGTAAAMSVTDHTALPGLEVPGTRSRPGTVTGEV